MTPSPTKEVIERLRTLVFWGAHEGDADPYMEDLATLLASHDKLVKELKEAAHALEMADSSTGYCCCGDAIEGHSVYSGHTPVDQGDYHTVNLVNDFRALLEELGQ